MRSKTLIAATFALFLFGCSSNPAENNNSIAVGAHARLKGGSESAIVALDIETLSKFETAQAAKDEYGIKELLRSGGVFLIPNQTKVLVIDRQSVGAWKVRILEGEHANEAVWTDEAWMIKE